MTQIKPEKYLLIIHHLGYWSTTIYLQPLFHKPMSVLVSTLKLPSDRNPRQSACQQNEYPTLWFNPLNPDGTPLPSQSAYRVRYA